MNYRLLTDQYYSQCLGQPDILYNAENGIHFVYSSERNTIQYGYSAQFDLYAFCQEERIIISYGDRAKEKIDILKETATLNFGDFKKTVSAVFKKAVNHNIKYYLQQLNNYNPIAKELSKSEFPQYLTFFKGTNSSCKNTDWLAEYFEEMTADHLCCGVFENGILTSCTDAPSMPYMADQTQEVGINTLPKYRSKGYAAAACVLCAENIIKNGKCPQWSTAFDNMASQRLSEKVGFVKIADVLTLTI